MQSTRKPIKAALLAIGLAAVVAGTVRAASAGAPIADGGDQSGKTVVAEPWKRIGQGTGGMGGIGGFGGTGGMGGFGGTGGIGGSGGMSPLHD